MSAKVWLVDEDLSVRESLGFLLKTLDYEVADFADLMAFDAATAAQHAPLRGCLLLDVRMPGIERWLAESGERHSLLPMIAMADDDTREAFQQRAFAVFVKPLDIESLLKTVHQAVKESEQRAQRQTATGNGIM